MNEEQRGRLQAIWLKRAKRGPMDPVERARAVPGRGLEGNANQGGRRQVTLLGAEAWQDAERELGAAVDPRLRRANLFLAGLDLAGSRGRTLRLGPCRIRIWGETRPCERMDEGHPGLRRALEPGWRGGAYGEIVEGGELAVGDRAEWDDAESAV